MTRQRENTSREAGKKNPVWIAWETQRRTLTLSRKLGFELRIFDHEKLGLLRYPWSTLRTLSMLLRERPSLVAVQNPSMALAALACALKPLLGFALIVDRHSNFLLARRKPRLLRDALFGFLSRFTLRRADLTIVTNGEIADRVAAASGRAFILPDPYPDWIPALPAPERGVPEAVFVCSWADDEPIPEVMEACEMLEGEIVLHVTGKPKSLHRDLIGRRPGNFRPTGFLPDEDYFRLLRECDAMVVLTTMPSTLVCGAYESAALGKPLLLSGSAVLKKYFHLGALHLDSHEPREIAGKMRRLIARRRELGEEMLTFLRASREEWEKRRKTLLRELDTLQTKR
jgi:glycosyltransferase involved in cell wall biosynthesis